VTATLNHNLRGYIEATRDYFAAPSVALTVVKGEETVLETFGTTRTGGDIPVTEKTLFTMGAGSRAYTAAATALLVDKGLLGWDDRVQSYLPEFVLPDPWITDHLTLRDLLGQRIALEPLNLGSAGQDSSFGELKDTTRIAGFRERYAPLPLAYRAVAEIFARVSEQPFADFLKQRLFDPLGLEHTLSAKTWPDLADLAQPHTSGPNSAAPLDPAGYSPCEGGGGIFTSAADSAIWLRLHLRRGFLERTPIIKWTSMIDILSPQIVAEPDARRGEVIAGYGMGWHIANYADAQILYQEGHEAGTSALNLLLPRENLGIAVRLGLDCPPAVRAITYRLLDAFLNRSPVDWAPRFKAWAEEDRVAAEAQAG